MAVGRAVAVKDSERGFLFVGSRRQRYGSRARAHRLMVINVVVVVSLSREAEVYLPCVGICVLLVRVAGAMPVVKNDVDARVVGVAVRKGVRIPTGLKGGRSLQIPRREVLYPSPTAVC